MPTRPNIKVAQLLAVLSLLLIASPADAAARHHARHGSHRLVAHWNGGHGVKTKRTKARRHPNAASVTGGQPQTGAGATNPSTGSGSSAGNDGPANAASAQTDPMFGVFTDGSPYDGNVNSVDALQNKLSRHIDIVNWYQNWTPGSWAADFHSDVLGAVTGSGRKPLLTWEPWDPSKGADQPQFRLRKIVDGDWDSYIASWADALAANGSTVYLRPMHEMNGNWYPWGASVGDNTPELYVKAWRHMVDIFKAHGADNVKFVWCPVPWSVPDTKDNALENYYPGDKYVDVLSVDGYNWGSNHPDWGGWQSFDQIFSDVYKRLSKLGPQPIWIAEVGSAPQGGDKAAWVRDMWKTARGWNRLKAIVWFDQNKEEDWRVSPVANAFSTR